MSRIAGDPPVPTDWVLISFSSSASGTEVVLVGDGILALRQLSSDFEEVARQVLDDVQRIFDEPVRPDARSRRHGAVLDLHRFTYDSVSRHVWALLDSCSVLPSGVVLCGDSAAMSLPVSTAIHPERLWSSPIPFVRMPAHAHDYGVDASDSWRLRIDCSSASDLAFSRIETELVRLAHASGSPDRESDRRFRPLYHVIGHGDQGLSTSQLQRDTHLVLSTCSSALQREGRLSSLQLVESGFVRSALGSLWPVGDEGTSSFMAIYHRELARGTSPAEALWRTQGLHRGCPLDMWSGFVHDGWPL